MQVLVGGLVVLSLAVLSQAGSLGFFVTMALFAMLVVGNLLVVRRAIALRRGGVSAERAVAGPLAASWLVVTILPLHSFIIRPTTVAVSEVGVEPAIELSYFLVVAAFAVTVIGRFEPGLQVARPPILLLALPVWAMASATWSPFGPYAFARGLQMLIIAVLAWATVAAAREHREVLDVLIGTYLRWLVRLAVGLVFVGLALGPIFVPAGGANLERFTWMGAHPNASGLVLAAALIVALTAPGSVLRLSPVSRAMAVVTMVAALYANHSRMSWLELVCGASLTFALAGRLRPLLRSVGAPLVAMVGFAAYTFWGARIGEYLLRDDDSESLATGNGRLGLWSVGARALDTLFDWTFGLGYGVARTMFLDVGPWARNAHNSILSWLVSGGIVAVILLLAIVFTVVRNLTVVQVIRARPDGIALVGLLAVLGMNGLASDAMAEPTMGFGGLYLVTAVSIALRDAHRAGQVPVLEARPDPPPVADPSRAARRGGSS
ncbi:MAG: O-antigen ligase family protein [Acidimicrobiales bacterium]